MANLDDIDKVMIIGSGPIVIGHVLKEESVPGREVLELEVVRDAKNRITTVCFIENVDAMGIYTGDSFITGALAAARKIAAHHKQHPGVRSLPVKSCMSAPGRAQKVPENGPSAASRDNSRPAESSEF